jgi:hypothetical protein
MPHTFAEYIFQVLPEPQVNPCGSLYFKCCVTNHNELADKKKTI